MAMCLLANSVHETSVRASISIFLVVNSRSVCEALSVSIQLHVYLSSEFIPWISVSESAVAIGSAMKSRWLVEPVRILVGMEGVVT